MKTTFTQSYFKKSSNLLKSLCIIIIIALMFKNSVMAQVSINNTEETVTLDFNEFDASGFSPDPTAGQLDSDNWSIIGLSDGTLEFGGNGLSTDFTRGIITGGEFSGGIYAFDLGNNNIALGVQPTGSDFTPGSITLRVQNNTGSTIANIALAYDILVNNDGTRSNSFNLSYSLDNITYHEITDINFSSQEEPTSSVIFETFNRSTEVSGLALENEGLFYIRWSSDDVSGSGNRDEIGLDNISLTAQSESENINPSLVLTAEDGLYELTLDGAEIRLTIDNGSFVDNVFDIANFTVSNGPLSTISIENIVADGDDAVLTLSYVPEDFDENFDQFAITVAGAEITGDLILGSNFISILANQEDEATQDFTQDLLNTTVLSSVQIPGDAQLFDEGAAEISAYHPESNRVFITNGRDNAINVLNITNPSAPAFENQIDLSAFASGGGPNSVAVFDGEVDLIAVAIGNDDTQANGVIALFDANTLEPVGDANGIEAGALPDFVTFNNDGTKIVVANEGEPNDNISIDPEGSITIIDITDINNMVVTHANFNAFDSQEESLKASGVRIFTPSSTEADGTATVSQDLEPEFITIDGNTAYVACQENNAIAVVNLSTSTVTNIFALGVKDHSIAGQGLDASNRDDQINIANWPVFGMYQPDAITFYNGFILTANEGDGREYDTFEEVERIGDFNLDATAFPNASALQQNEALGRLEATLSNGDIDGDGDYDQLWSFGARSFSIWDPSSGSEIALTFDSGNDLEQIVKARNPEFFNTTNDENVFENRSDDAGPEPEGITVGEVNGSTYAFIGLERESSIVAYDITNTTEPSFAAYFSNRNFEAEPSEATNNAELFNSGDLGPEGLAFVSAEDSPTRQSLLIVSNEVSGTITIWGIGEEIAPATLSLSVSNENPIEGDVLTVTATASEPVFDNQTVEVSIAGISENDFSLSANQITIENGSLSGEIELTIIDDAEFEEEIATVSIVNPSEGLILGDNTTVTITIDDSADEIITGIENELNNSLNIYPVPASENIYVESSTEYIGKIELITLSGALISTTIPVQNKASIDVSELKAGIYLIEIFGTDKSISITKKIIISK